MDRDYIVNYLKTKNYWWTRGDVEPEDKGILRRNYVKEVEETFKYERIIALSGLRRSGKTTILFQVIDTLIKKVEPGKIVYFKIDDLIEKIDNLQDIIKIYQEISGKDPIKEEIFFFIDELHFLKNWQLQIKYYIDAHAKSKFIISGSSKTLLYKDASESLVGRIKFIDVFPLTFKEFLGFNGMTIEILADFLDYKKIQDFYYDLITQKEQIIYYFNQYMEIGGFPEWFKVKNLSAWYKMLEDYISLILFKDVVTVFKIKDPMLLDKMVKEIAQLSTNRFSYLGLSNRLGADRETIKLYLYYLKSSMLIFTAEVYSKTKRMREMKEKKVYLCEEGLRKAITLDTDEAKAVENIVAWHLTKKGFEAKTFFTPFYWKNKYEVDFVFDDSKRIVPVEVKYRGEISNTDIKGLLEFAEKFKLKEGVVITRDLLECREIEGKEILFIPAWLFLLGM